MHEHDVMAKSMKQAPSISVYLSGIVKLATSSLKLSDYQTIVHVGPSKTGSSAIQEALNRSRENLVESGIYYPSHQTDINLISSGHLHTILTYHNSKWDVSWRKVLAILSELDRQRCNRLVLSSEFFAAKVLLASLSRSFRNLVAVAYIRDAFSLISSEYIQSVKRFGMTLPLLIEADELFKPWFYQRLEDCVRSSIPFEYFAYQSKDGGSSSIVTPILDLVSYAGPAINCKKINRSYTFEALEFKRASNHYLGKDHLGRLDSVLQQCRLGTSSYNILSEEQFVHVKKSVSSYISKLRRSRELVRLADVIEQAQPPQPPEVRHRGGPNICLHDQIREILQYVDERDPVVVKVLRQAVRFGPTPETVPDAFVKALM
jgi:hypothetical protein